MENQEQRKYRRLGIKKYTLLNGEVRTCLDYKTTKYVCKLKHFTEDEIAQMRAALALGETKASLMKRYNIGSYTRLYSLFKKFPDQGESIGNSGEESIW
jgi:hypothetical protein